MAKKEKKFEGDVVVDVNQDVTTVTDVPTAVQPAVDTVKKATKAKKVSDVVVSELERKYSELKERYDAHLDTMSSLTADNERLSDELENAVKENKSLRKELSKDKQDLRRLRAERDANTDLIESLSGKLSHSESQNSALEKELSETKEYVESLEVELDKMRYELNCYKRLGFWKRVKFVFCPHMKVVKA